MPREHLPGTDSVLLSEPRQSSTDHREAEGKSHGVGQIDGQTDDNNE